MVHHHCSPLSSARRCVFPAVLAWVQRSWHLLHQGRYRLRCVASGSTLQTCSPASASTALRHEGSSYLVSAASHCAGACPGKSPCPSKCRSAAQSIWRVASQLLLTTAHCINPLSPEGLEFSGIVTAVGPQSTQSTDGSSTAPAPLAIGDRVLGVTRFGAYASAINLRFDYVRRVPDSWSLEEAAAYPVQTLTGVQATRDAPATGGCCAAAAPQRVVPGGMARCTAPVIAHAQSCILQMLC